MSDLDHLDPRLDAAFGSLARDLAQDPGPGAAAAVSTARRRRRTRVGAVALAAVLVVGAGLTVPRLFSPEDGVAADGGSARLDTAAVAEATEGWIGDWETWDPSSPWGSASFNIAACPPPADVDPLPQPVTRGGSRFVSHSGSYAATAILRFATPERATSAQAPTLASYACGKTTTYVVDGVQVRYDSVQPTGGQEGGMWLGMWSAQIGSDLGLIQVTNQAGAADEESAERLAEALVAGLRDGWTQSGMSQVPPPEPAAG